MGSHEGELPKGRQIHIHEGEKGPKIEEFPRMLEGVANMLKGDGANKSDRANDQDVISRSGGTGAQVGEDFSWQHVVAAHAKEQPGGPHDAQVHPRVLPAGW